MEGSILTFSESENERRKIENSTHHNKFVSFGDLMNSQETCAFPVVSDDRDSNSEYSDEQSI